MAGHNAARPRSSASTRGWWPRISATKSRCGRRSTSGRALPFPVTALAAHAHGLTDPEAVLRAAHHLNLSHGLAAAALHAEMGTRLRCR